MTHTVLIFAPSNVEKKINTVKEIRVTVASPAGSDVLYWF